MGEVERHVHCSRAAIMNLRSFLFLLLLPACGAEPSNIPLSEATGNAQSRATFDFTPTAVEARRMPVAAGCGEKNAPFTDDDIFSLQPIDGDAPYGVKSIAVSFHRTVVKGVALDLTLGAPVRGATFSGAEHASSPDEDTGVGLVVFGNPNSSLSKATVTMTDVPAKDGDATSAHVILEFADGDVLDESFTGSLESYEGACATGGG
jgi:hypothetical protein